MGKEDVICLKCGHNLETGRRLSTKRIVKRGGLNKALTGGALGARVAVPPQILAAARWLRVLSLFVLFVGIVFAVLFAWLAFSLTGFELIQALVPVPSFAQALLAVLGLVAGLTGFWAAAGIVGGDKTAWMTSLVLAGIGLFYFPIGTGLGVAILMPLMSDESREYCQA
jgi:hypothetical protein